MLVLLVPVEGYDFNLTLDIERTYGQKKLLASRIPIPDESTLSRKPSRSSQTIHQRNISLASDISTPSATEGETATETEEFDTETETETDCIEVTTPRSGSPVARFYSSATRSSKTRVLSQHDLLNMYFRKDVIMLRNFDFLRFVDVFGSFILLLIIPYQSSGLYARPHHSLRRHLSLPSASVDPRPNSLAFHTRISMASLSHILSRLASQGTEQVEVPR